MAKFTDLDALTLLALADLVCVIDDVAGTPSSKKITVENFWKALNVLNAEASPAVDDLIAVYDTGESTTDKMTLANVLKVIDALTELAATPAASDTVLVLDGGVPKKIQYSNLVSGGGQARKSLPVSAAHLPDDSANNAAAQIQKKTSSGGTLHPAWVEALFDDGTDEHIMFSFLMPDNYASAPVVDVYYKAAAATSGTAAFAAALMAVTDGDSQDVDADAFDTANVGTATVPGTAGHMDVISITMSNADSVAANDWVNLVMFRDVSGDSVTGDLEVVLVVLRYTSI